MLSPFLVSPLKTPYPILFVTDSVRVFPPPTHSCFPVLAFLYTRTLRPHRTKGRSSH